MFRRSWQKAMIGLARHGGAKRLFQSARTTSALAERYVAGDSIESGIARAHALMAQWQIHSSLYFLGEYVDSLDLVAANLAAKRAIAAALGRAGLDVHVSVDPTQIGHSIDRNLAAKNAFTIAEEVADAGAGRPGLHTLMLDMEDHSIVDATIALRDQGELPRAARPHVLGRGARCRLLPYRRHP